jgi:hypothetical protein
MPIPSNLMSAGAPGLEHATAFPLQQCPDKFSCVGVIVNDKDN